MANNQEKKAEASSDEEIANEPLPPDFFEREQMAQKLVKVVTNLHACEVSPLIIHGPWGSGKSVYASRIIEILKGEAYSKTIKTLYWNASESDYLQDPLTAFVAFLYNFVPADKEEEYQGNAIKLCMHATVAAIGEMLNGVAANATGINCKEIVKAAENAIDSDIKHDNPEYIQFISFLKKSKEASLRIKAAQALIRAAAEGKNIIIIVDELDRCKPIFTLKLFEEIKHLFSMDFCKFILVLNKDSLTSSVASLYGLSNYDADFYLGKYSKIEFALPLLMPSSGKDCNLIYFKKLLAGKGHKVLSYSPFLEDFVSHYTRYRNVHLREIEKVSKTIKIFDLLDVRGVRSSNNIYFSLLLTIVAFLGIADQKLLSRISIRDISSGKVMAALGYTNSIVVSPDSRDVRLFLSDIFSAYLTNEDGSVKYDYLASQKRVWSDEFYDCLIYFQECLSWSMMIN